jgi:hypothetical protein
MSILELTNLALKILKANPDCFLSGSLALSIQGIKTRRQPHDIDIYLPFNGNFKFIEGLVVSKNDQNDEYDDDWYERESYEAEGVKVDVFTPKNETIPMPRTACEKGLEMIYKSDIIGFKVDHSFGEHWTRVKHKDDVIHILVNNPY